MTLSFLDKEAERELVHRIERAREPEEKRYRERKAAIMADHRDRGLYNSTACIGAVRNEEINHLRQIARIARDELFAIVEAMEIRLSDTDVKAISDYLAENFKRSVGFLKQELVGMAAQTGLPMGNDQAFDMQVGQAIHHEAIAEVSVRATELRRTLDRRRRKWWSERIEKLVWLVGGVGLGILGTLATQWLAK